MWGCWSWCSWMVQLCLSSHQFFSGHCRVLELVWLLRFFFKLYVFIRQLVAIKEKWFVLETWTRRWEVQGTMGIPLNHPAEVKRVREPRSKMNKAREFQGRLYQLLVTFSHTWDRCFASSPGSTAVEVGTLQEYNRATNRIYDLWVWENSIPESTVVGPLMF